MTALINTKNLQDHDGFYADLLDTHAGLSEQNSHALNAQLILVLANHIGDRQVLREALSLARQNFG